MGSVTVTADKHSFVFSRDGRFLTSVPIRRWSRIDEPGGKVMWVHSNPRFGEVIDLIRRLTITVNSDSPGSLLSKISSELNTPYTPTETLVKSRNTRIKNFNNRLKGLGPPPTNGEKTAREARKRSTTRKKTEKRAHRGSGQRVTVPTVRQIASSTQEAA